jgi:large subunit ribosomal protein L10
MLSRVQKQTEVAELRDRFTRATSVFVAEYRGLDVAAVDALRAKMRAAGTDAFEYRVAKNTLLRKAAEGSTGAALTSHFHGPTAVAFSFGDPAKLAKILVDYAKDREHFKMRGAIVEGTPLGMAEIARLATLPSLDELRGKLIGLLQAPAGQLARLLAAPPGQLARVIGARHKQLEEAAGGGAES